MSYDVNLEIDTGGEYPADLGLDWNYTTNCAPMWRKAGADLVEFHGKPAGECEPILARAILNMISLPNTYRAMSPPNRWGDYDSLLERLEVLRAAFAANPKATVRVSR